ncbi:MAG: alpha/beta hydrolase [Rhodospirillaceae bacterium]|nr:alpha/beta hydrolase [Rhodospirillaceae bacterium]
MRRNDQKLGLELKSFAAPSANMTYLAGGAGSVAALVLLPGWAGSFSFWRAQIKHFESRLRIVAIDYAGCVGASVNHPATSRGEALSQRTAERLSLDQIALDISHLLESEGISRCTLVGHSIGGAVALSVAALSPASSSRVVGIDSLTYTDLYPKQSEDVVQGFTGGFKTAFEQTLRGLVDGYFLDGTAAPIREWVVETMLGVDQGLAIDLLAAFLRWDLNEQIRACECEVHVIAAEETFDRDAFLPRYGDRISVETVSDSGHFLMIDQPDECNERLSQLLGPV